MEDAFALANVDVFVAARRVESGVAGVLLCFCALCGCGAFLEEAFFVGEFEVSWVLIWAGDPAVADKKTFEIPF